MSKKAKLKRSPSVEPPRRAASEELSQWSAPWRAQPAQTPVNHMIRSTLKRSFPKQPPVQRMVAMLKQRSHNFVVFTAKPTAATATSDPFMYRSNSREAVSAFATSSNE